MTDLKDLEKEVCCLVSDFSASLGFSDIESMRETAQQFKTFSVCEQNISPFFQEHKQDAEKSESPLVLSPSQNMNKSRRSMFVSKLLISSDEEEEEEIKKQNERDKTRRSRRSVCVSSFPRSSSEDEVDDIDDSVENYSDTKESEKTTLSPWEQEENDSDTGDDDIQFKSRKRAKLIISSDESEDEEKSFYTPDLPQDVTRKISYNDTSNEIEEICKSFSQQDISSDSDTTDNYSDVKSDPDNIANLNSYDESDIDNKYNNIVTSHNLRKITPVKPSVTYANRIAKHFLTPHSATKSIIGQINTPQSIPGTPGYKREFRKMKDKIVGELYQLYNKTVFDNQLPEDLKITWNNRMTKTAGFCYYGTIMGKRQSSIELSDKVLDSTERVRDTLIHELCHAATWLINGLKDGHGSQWKYWAKKANRIHPDLPVIMRCHKFEINFRYNYKCNKCGKQFGRFSKSINPNKDRCSACGGIPELLNSAKKSKINPFGTFLKKNFSSVKESNPNISHKELMNKLSDMFKQQKIMDKENASRVFSQ